MISSVFHRRHSERLAQLLDEASGGRRHHAKSGVDDNLSKLVAVSRRLADLPIKVEAHPEFRDGLRAMLLATIEREGIGATAVAAESETEAAKRRIPVVGGALRRPGGVRPPMARRTKARGAIVIGLAAGTLALSGMSAASGDAIPGDPLYTVKRSTERAQLALAGSDISRGQLYLEFARTRLDEARAVQSDPSGFARVLDDMDSETQQGVKLLTTTAIEHKDAKALDAIDAFVKTQHNSTEGLRNGVSGDPHNRANKSLTLLDEIQKRAGALRLVLSCGTAATSGADPIGPLPKLDACKTSGTGRGNPTSRNGNTEQNGQTGQTGQSDQTATENGVAPTVPAPGGTSVPPQEAGTPQDAPGSPTNGGLLDPLHDLVHG